MASKRRALGRDYGSRVYTVSAPWLNTPYPDVLARKEESPSWRALRRAFGSPGPRCMAGRRYGQRDEHNQGSRTDWYLGHGSRVDRGIWQQRSSRRSAAAVLVGGDREGGQGVSVHQLERRQTMSTDTSRPNGR